MDCFGFLNNNNKKKKKNARGASDRVGGAPAAPAAMTSMSSSVSRSTASTVSQKSIPELYEEKAHNLRAFEFDELMNATNNFSRMNKIGEGGFGSVYRGYIKGTLDGVDDKRRMVAIKKLNQRSMQGHKQWLAEVQFLAVVEHPNLVELLGYCAKDGERGIERLLVYEFMPNKSLEDHLFNRAYPVLPWSLRLQIALGVAEGLQYLHEGLEVQVIYRDFKASNVLLDNDFKPKLSDFGLAREGPAEGRTHVTTAVVGTYGYAAPDYVETGHLTAKSDVWSFGVVSFEILTGRRSLDRNRPNQEQKLLDWVKQFPIERKKFTMIMDPRLRHEYSVEAAREMAKLANACLVKNTRERPSMSQVVDRLRRIMRVEVESQEH